MKKRAITFLNALSLLLCFAVIVSWARSTVSSEGVTINHGYTRYSAVASEGAIIFIRGTLIFETPEVEQAWRGAVDPQRNLDWNRWRASWARDLGMVGLANGSTLGFGVETSETDATRRVLMAGVKRRRLNVQVPHWFLIVLTGIAPGLWLYRHSQTRSARIATGLCRKCGFELGDVYHSCPKCGERAPLPEGFGVIET